MDTTIKLKFQPLWIVFFDIVSLPLFYKAFDIRKQVPDKPGLIIAYLPVLLLLYYLVSLTIKMVAGKAAIVLTDEYLVDNLGNRAIKWSNISSIELYNKGFRSFARLNINLKNPDDFFDTPLKQFKYKFRQFFTANDISILIDFVSGDAEGILQTIYGYWDKSAGL